MRIDSLTSLRLFAALAVFVHHMEFFQNSPSAPVREVFQWFWEGFVGVQFFFVLSGFVISYSFTGRLRKGPFPFSDFLFFRAARLFPTHWLTMIVAIFLYGSLGGPSVDSLLRLVTQVTLTQSLVVDPSFFFNFNAVSWSISVEIFFYLAFCLVVALPTRVLAGIWVAMIAIVVVNILRTDPGQVPTTWLLYINPAFRFVDFLTGMLLHRWYAARPLRMTVLQATVAEIGALGLIAVFVFAAIKGGVGIQWRWDIYYVLPAAAVVFVFAHQQGALSAILKHRWLILLGDASFALYMVHQLLIAVALRYFPPGEIVGFRSALLYAVPILIAGIGLSLVVHLYFERPVNAALRRWWERRSAAAQSRRRGEAQPNQVTERS